MTGERYIYHNTGSAIRGLKHKAMLNSFKSFILSSVAVASGSPTCHQRVNHTSVDTLVDPLVKLSMA